EGRGDANGTPFITLKGVAQLSGLTIYYPEQNDVEKIVEYPWTVRADGDNCTIRNLLIVNPYNAVDFGTKASGRHYINGLYAQPLKTGLFIDKCFDVAGVEIGPDNQGPVKFTACGFWGVSGETNSHVISHSNGNVTLTACHFISWAQAKKDAPCISADRGSITVNGCEFLDDDPAKIHI